MNLGLGSGLHQLGLGSLGVGLGGTFQDDLGEDGSELLDLVDGNAGDGADDLVDTDLRWN